MEQVHLKYGTSAVDFEIDGAKSVKYLYENKMRVIEDIKAEFLHCVTDGVIGTKPLKELIAPTDPVTIVISDMTRFWMRQDVICELLVKYLHDEMGVGYDQIAVVVALGTHRKNTAEDRRKLASEFVYDHVASVTDHDCDAPDPEKPMTDVRVGSGLVENNPINLDMREAGAMVHVTFGINIVVDTSSRHSGLFCGEFDKAWQASCSYVQKGYGLPIDYQADVVIASCGGFPKDLNFYQSTKTLFNASRAVKEGGTLIMLAECPEGSGSRDFFDWIKPLSKGCLDEALRASFTIGGYIFYAACESIRRSKTLLLSSMEPELVRDMGVRSFKDMKDLLAEVDFNGKDVYVIPYGGSVLPQTKEAYERICREAEENGGAK